MEANPIADNRTIRKGVKQHNAKIIVPIIPILRGSIFIIYSFF